MEAEETHIELTADDSVVGKIFAVISLDDLFRRCVDSDVLKNSGAVGKDKSAVVVMEPGVRGNGM